MRRLQLFALALMLTACATSGRPLGGGGAAAGDAEDPFSSSTSRPSQIRIEVQNLNFQDARLYALRSSGTRVSLGSVGGKTDAVFDVDWQFNMDLRIEINLLAGPRCTTRPIQVQPGDILQLQIASVFSQSRACY